MNKVILIGNVGRDPEIRHTTADTTVANFSLATSTKWTKDGQRHEQTEWHNIVAFGRTAEVIHQYVTKGREVCIEGKLRTSSWEDKDSGQKRYRTEIIVGQLHLLRSGGGDSYKQEGGEAPYEDDDIPF